MYSFTAEMNKKRKNSKKTEHFMNNIDQVRGKNKVFYLRFLPKSSGFSRETERDFWRIWGMEAVLLLLVLKSTFRKSTLEWESLEIEKSTFIKSTLECVIDFCKIDFKWVNRLSENQL